MEEKLREAACHGDIDALQSILRSGIDVNCKHKMNGWTALHWASRRNQIPAIEVRFQFPFVIPFEMYSRVWHRFVKDNT